MRIAQVRWWLEKSVPQGPDESSQYEVLGNEVKKRGHVPLGTIEMLGFWSRTAAQRLRSIIVDRPVRERR